MVLCGGVYGRAYKRAGRFYTLFNIVRAAAYPENSFFAAVDLANGKMRALHRLALGNLADYDVCNVLAQINQFFHFEAAAEKLFLQFLRGNVNINVIFKPT